MNAALARHRDDFRKRTERYARLGHDRYAAARFVAEAGGPLAGPVLDVGTGKGLLATALATAGARVVSVDLESGDQALAGLLAEEAGVREKVEFVRGDAARLPFTAGRFRAAAMMAVLHHLDDPASVLRDITRTLEHGATLIVADFSDAGFDLVARVHRAEGREHPRGGITVDQAVSLLEGCGLRCVGRHEGHLHQVAVLGKGGDIT